jgi:hypothetical protein
VRLKRSKSKSGGAPGPLARMSLKSRCMERSMTARWARTCSTVHFAPSG